MKTINYIVLAIAAILAFFSFSISYLAMSGLADENNIRPSCLFPLIIDGVILLALIWRLAGNEKDLSRIVIGGYMILSIACNALAHGSVVSAVLAAIAPITLFVTSEIASGMLNSDDTNGKIELINAVTEQRQMITDLISALSKQPKRNEKGQFVKQGESNE
jgi:hypothetical protein